MNSQNSDLLTTLRGLTSKKYPITRGWHERIAAKLPWWHGEHENKVLVFSVGVETNRMYCWRFDATTTAEDMQCAVEIVDGWANALGTEHGEYDLGMTPGQYWFLTLAQSMCTFDANRYKDVSGILHMAIAQKRVGRTVCNTCYDVGEVLEMCADYCGNPGCTDVVNAGVRMCPKCGKTEEQ